MGKKGELHQPLHQQLYVQSVSFCNSVSFFGFSPLNLRLFLGTGAPTPQGQADLHLSHSTRQHTCHGPRGLSSPTHTLWHLLPRWHHELQGPFLSSPFLQFLFLWILLGIEALAHVFLLLLLFPTQLMFLLPPKRRGLSGHPYQTTAVRQGLAPGIYEAWDILYGRFLAWKPARAVESARRTQHPPPPPVCDLRVWDVPGCIALVVPRAWESMGAVLPETPFPSS